MSEIQNESGVAVAKTQSITPITRAAIGVLVVFSLLAVLSVSACAPKVEENPYGVRGTQAELSALVDNTLASQWNNDPGQAFSSGPVTGEGDLEGITFSEPVMCNVDASLDEMIAALSAHPEADVVFARESVITGLTDAGYITPNFSALNIAEIPVLDNVYLLATRATQGAGAQATLPDTRLIGGDDDLQSGQWRLSYLPEWNGRIAIGPDTSMAGQAFNQALAAVGLYSDESGQNGTYDPSIEGKVLVASSVAEALDWTAEGKADVAFAYTFDLAGRQDVAAFYEVPTALYTLRPNYKGAVLNTSANKDAARWYLNVIYKMI